jgi:hypothetical protein
VTYVCRVIRWLALHGCKLIQITAKFSERIDSCLLQSFYGIVTFITHGTNHQNQERREIRLAAKERKTGTLGAQDQNGELAHGRKKSGRGKTEDLLQKIQRGNKSGVQAPRPAA